MTLAVTEVGYGFPAAQSATHLNLSKVLLVLLQRKRFGSTVG